MRYTNFEYKCPRLEEFYQRNAAKYRRTPDEAVKQNVMNRAGAGEKGGAAMEEGRCPCCGRALGSFLYLRGGEVVGCEGCVTAFEVWELPPEMTEEGRWEHG